MFKRDNGSCLLHSTLNGVMQAAEAKLAAAQRLMSEHQVKEQELSDKVAHVNKLAAESHAERQDFLAMLASAHAGESVHTWCSLCLLGLIQKSMSCTVDILHLSLLTLGCCVSLRCQAAVK